MRIIAGYLGGRTFQSPKGHRTHPMSDKVRGAIFNMLGDIDGISILDAYSGSGALSFEAASRGAGKIIAIDIDKNAHDTISSNAKSLGLSQQIKAIRANSGSWSENNPDTVFDIVICDPPYDKIQSNAIQNLIRNIANDGLLVLSWPGDQDLPDFEGVNKIADKSYGDAKVGVYKSTKPF